MATRYFVGAASAQRHQYEFTLSAVGAAGTTWWLTLNGRVGPKVTVASGETVASLIDKLATAYQEAGGAEWLAMTYTPSATVLYVLGPADGRDPALVLNNSAAVAFTAAEPVTGTGPHHWTNTENWTAGTLPVAGDDVVVVSGTPKFGIALSGTAFASVTFLATAGGAGLPDINPLGHAEYLAQRTLDLNCTSLRYSTSGYGRVKLATTACPVTVDSPTSSAVGLDLATDATNGHSLKVVSGTVRVADGAGETAKLSAGAVVGTDSGIVTTLGAGLTVATVTQNNGTVYLKCPVTTSYVKVAGALHRTGAGAVAALTNRSGTLDDRSTGTITAAHNYGSWVYAGAGCTYTTLTAYPNSALEDADGKVTFTNAIVLSGCHLAGPLVRPGAAPAWLNLGVGRNVTV